MAALRLRTDEWHTAGAWRAVLLGAAPDPRADPHRWARHFTTWLEEGHEEAKVGDVWRLRRCPTGPHIVQGYAENHLDWPVSHYALVCPVATCADGVHGWAHAYDCPAGDHFGAECKVGPGRLSCWTWTGSIEAGTLTASPSLHILPASAPTFKTCEFHGFLTNGVLA